MVVPGRSRSLPDLLQIAANRVSSFLAEAAVLVLVLGILERFLARERFELRWAGGASLISLGLLAGSIGLEWSARGWQRRA